jgi:hypothetical protein
MQVIFNIGALSASDCAFSLLVALIPVTAIELSKLARRRWRSPLSTHGAVSERVGGGHDG